VVEVVAVVERERVRMESRWRKAKMSLGLNLCVYVPRTLDDGDSPSTGSSTAALVSPVASSSSAATSANTTPTAEQRVKGAGALMPTTPTPTSAGLRLSKSGSKSFKVQSLLHILHISMYEA
jgi:hypothetical protein